MKEHEDPDRRLRRTAVLGRFNYVSMQSIDNDVGSKKGLAFST